MTVIIVALIGVLTAIFGNNKISELLSFIKARKKNKYIVNKIRRSKRIKDLVVSVREHYKVDRVLLYYMHNGQIASNGFSFYKFSIFEESYNEQLLRPNIQDQQNMPIALMADFFIYYLSGGFINCPTKNVEVDSDLNMYEHMSVSNVKSTYSKGFKDLNGNYTCVLVMNSEMSEKEIIDFDYFNQVGNIIGELMTEKK